MKFTKMSLVAALLVGSSAFAIENVKVSGDAKLYYSTLQGGANDAFNTNASTGQAALGLGGTADLGSGISAGLHTTVLSTLGLENNLVTATWAGNIAPSGATAGNNLQGSNGTAWWVDNAWMATTVAKTTVKIGRMDLDTPLAFTETWNIAKNTFEAAVLINQDIPDTTLVLAYVGGGNGASHGAVVANAQNGNTPFTGYTSHNEGAERIGAALGTTAFNAVGGAGAYAIAVVNNSFKPLTAQAWYYNVKQVTDAYWLQADLNMEGILVGAQFTGLTLKDRVTSLVDGTSHNVAPVAAAHGLDLTTTAFSVMAGYALKDVVTAKIAYSSVSDDGILSVANTATGNQSKLYTEAWWNYGYVGKSGSDSVSVSAEGSYAEVALLGQFTHASIKPKGAAETETMDELTLTASKSFGPLDTTAALIYTNIDNIGSVATDSSASGTIQAYLTYNF